MVGRNLQFARLAIAIPFFVGGSAAICQDEQPSIRKLFDDAQQLSRDEANRDQAAAKYRELIEQHSENQKLIDTAMRAVVRTYLDAGDAEAAARFFIELAVKKEAEQRDTAFREIARELQTKHREVFQKVLQEKGLAGGPNRRVDSSPVPVPVPDLASQILQRENEELRSQSLATLREMLAADAQVQQHRNGLATLQKVLTAKFDRKPFRPLVHPLLKSEDHLVRMLAVGCIPALNAAIDDLEQVLPLVDDESPDVRKRVGAALVQIGNGEKPDLVIPALTKLLQDEDQEVVKQNIRSMWGQYHSPEYDRLLIELSDHPLHHHIVIYHCLSTMQSKSPAVCTRLVEELADPDWNNSGRAAWGLTYGVTDQSKSIVEEGLLKALPQETNDYTRKQEFRALQTVATEKSREYLQKVVDSELETEETKALASRILSGLK